MAEIELELKNAGLTGNEAKVYIALLKYGEVTANFIAKKIGMDRTLTYTILNNLIERGMVGYIIKENKKFFKPASPENLLRGIREKEQFIASIIPKLKKIKKIEESKQEVQVYEGKEGLKNFYEELLKSKSKDICSFGATGKSYDVLEYELPHIIKRAQKKGLNIKMITSHKFKGKEMTKIKGVKTRYLKEINVPATTTIFSDKVAIHVLTEKPIVMIIKNKEIADSYKKYFEVLWRSAKE